MLLTEDKWQGCYDESWAGLIRPEAMKHPAKFSRGLIRRIYGWLIEEGHLKTGQTVVDPFGGIGLGAYYALQHGVNWFGVELERNFVHLGRGCHCTGIHPDEWVRYYGRFRQTNFRDGRQWCPYCIAQTEQISQISPQLSLLERNSASYIRDSYKIPGTKPHDYPGHLREFRRHAWRHPDVWARLICGDSRELAYHLLRDGVRYGEPELANTGYIIITSPPFAGNSGGRGQASREGIDAALFDRHQGSMVGGVGDRERGNLGSLLAREADYQAVITSPPYMQSLASDDPDRRGGLFRDPKRRNDNTLTATYGASPGQLGVETIDNYWAAAHAIIGQCYLILPRGGTATFVTKDFVNRGQIVPFSRYWADLCEKVGFHPLAYFRASLVKKSPVQLGLDGKPYQTIKSKKSFFRRLAEAKGAPPIDHEDVLIFQK